MGNIPFLWTIDDLRKQFLVRKEIQEINNYSILKVFGPVKDPEIVSNERGSKVSLVFLF